MRARGAHMYSDLCAAFLFTIEIGHLSGQNRHIFPLRYLGVYSTLSRLTRDTTSVFISHNVSHIHQHDTQMYLVLVTAEK